MRLGVSDEQVAAAFVDLNGSRAAVAAMTGVLPQNISRALGKPHVVEEIRRLEAQRLVTEGLPAAINCLLEITTNKKAPAGARVMAAKVLLDRSLGSQEGAADKAPHEMTAAELGEAIANLERTAAARALNVTPAKPVVDDQVAGPDLFG